MALEESLGVSEQTPTWSCSLVIVQVGWQILSWNDEENNGYFGVPTKSWSWKLAAAVLSSCSFQPATCSPLGSWYTHICPKVKKTPLPETLRYWEWFFELAYSVFFIKTVFIWKMLTPSRYKQAKYHFIWWIRKHERCYFYVGCNLFQCDSAQWGSEN